MASSTRVQHAITTVAEDYLKTIWVAEAQVTSISINELAERMGVVASTASENVSRLKERGYIDHVPYQKVHLTDKGRSKAVGIVRRHRLIETYLYRKLGFEWDEIHEEAESLEHAISDRLLERIERTLGYPTRDPHGDPIPAADGTLYTPEHRPLLDSQEGAYLTVARISDRNARILRDLQAYRIVPGATLYLSEKADDGSCIVTLTDEEAHSASRDANIFLGAEHACAIYVVNEETDGGTFSP